MAASLTFARAHMQAQTRLIIWYIRSPMIVGEVQLSTISIHLQK